MVGNQAADTLLTSANIDPAGKLGAGLILLGGAGADLASATTIDLTAATGNTVVITGTTPTTGLTMTAGQQMILLPSGAWPMTFNATTLNINGGSSYTCAAGDRVFAVKDLAGVIRVTVLKQDGTAVVGGTSPIPAGTVMSFYQTAVPTGWTQVTTAALGDALLRLSVTTGGVTGGSTAFSTWSAVTATGAYTLATADIPSHTHVQTKVTGAAIATSGAAETTLNTVGASAQSTQASGGGGSHSHTVTRGLKYADFVVGSKN